MNAPDPSLPEAAIAIIGMACRLPGADTISEFWENLKDGKDVITRFDPEEIHDSPERIADPNYVPARGVINDAEMFDAALFGLTPREAAVMDPQQRIFLQTCLACLEDAGYNPETAGHALGLFAGNDPSTYEIEIRVNPKLRQALDHLQILIGNGLGFFSTRVSYLLNLRGPSVPVQTTCSTSLSAVHLACQSLLGFESDMALAGGCSIPVPVHTGHMYVEGGPLSPDGYCHTFDEQARGTALGSGAGCVLLKRLEDAVADGDHIYAVIRGSAFNNDGSAKVGFTAPSVEGQRRVIAEAISVSGLEPEDISFVETHGTATQLGDPIEVEALRQAFGSLPPNSVTLGAVKSNIGHCNAAAGIAGLIKTALSLYHRTIVPNLHFKKANPELQLETSPFTIPTQTSAWEAAERFAGVSAFGLGGTNVHVVLGEAPPVEADEPQPGPYLLTLSAESESALVRKRIQLQENLKHQPPANLADWTFTLNVGRKDWGIRQALVFDDVAGAIEALADRHALKPASHQNRVVFMFPGQGADYPDFGAALYRQSPVFRETVDECANLLAGELDAHLPDLMFSEDPAVRERLKEPHFWQPAIFVCEYALAKCWLALGLVPEAMVGHSIGEYVAATLAEVMQLEDALKLIAIRGRETQKLSGGAMLAVIADSEKVAPFLNDDIELAAINGPSLHILGGSADAIAGLKAQLTELGLQSIQLPTEHAFHTKMMAPLMTPIRDFLRSAPLVPPKTPIVSNLTGDWLTGEQAQDPDYWAKHTRGAVQFNGCLNTLFQYDHRVFLEVGPGQVLSKLASRHPGIPTTAIASTVEAEKLTQAGILSNLGQVWEQGVPLDWETIYEGQSRRRMSLPTYPFDKNRYWILDEAGPQEIASDPLRTRNAPTNWFYQPSWRQAPSLAATTVSTDDRWLVFAAPGSHGASLVESLQACGANVVSVTPGEAFQKQGESLFQMPFGDHQAYQKLLQNLSLNDRVPTRVIFEPPVQDATGADALESTLATTFDAAMHWARAMDSHAHGLSQNLYFLTHRLLDFGNQMPGHPLEGVLLGAAWVIAKEMPQLGCSVIDIDPAEAREQVLPALLTELTRSQPSDQVALRVGTRWEAHYQAVPLPAGSSALGETPHLVLANGLQPFGMALAGHFARNHGAKVVLLDRAFFPPSAEWDEWVAEQGEKDPVSQLILQLRGIDKGRGSITVRQAPLDNAQRLNAALAELIQANGAIQGYFHLEAPMEPGLIQTKAALAVSRLLAARIRDVTTLAQLETRPEFIMLFAENLGETGLGRSENAGYHTFLAHYARRLKEKGLAAMTVEWGTHAWASEEEAGHGSSGTVRQLQEKRELFGMSLEECAAAIAQLMGLDAPRVIVSTREYNAVLAQQRLFTAESMQTAQPTTDGAGHHARPELSSDMVAPRNEVERLLAEVWQSYFDIADLGVDDNFFELGGHSLLAVQLLAKINETFAAKLNMQALFDAPTIAGLATTLNTQDSGDDSENLEALLDEIEGLSEEELKKLLEAETSS